MRGRDMKISTNKTRKAQKLQVKAKRNVLET